VYFVKRSAYAFILTRRGNCLANLSDRGACDRVQKRLDGVDPQGRDRHPEEESALAGPCPYASRFLPRCSAIVPARAPSPTPQRGNCHVTDRPYHPPNARPLPSCPTRPRRCQSARRGRGLFLDEAFVERGFRYADGVVTPLEVPGSLWTSAWGTNGAGQIVGQYHDGRRPRGFLFEDGQFTSIDVSETMETFPFDINNRGQVVGWSHLSVDDPTHGFLAVPRRLGDLVGRLR
jgi:probable HAF family extracellular repeat protein